MLNICVKNHVFSVFKSFGEDNVIRIVREFEEYQKEAKLIKVTELREWELGYKIEYLNKNVGISWIVRPYTDKFADMSHIVEIIIDPIALLGEMYKEKDPYEFRSLERNYDFLRLVEKAYNCEAKKISENLTINFKHCRINNIELSIKMDLEQLKTGCTPEQLLELFNGSFLPIEYKKKTTNEIARANKDRDIFSTTDVQFICCGDYCIRLFRQYPYKVTLEDSCIIIPFKMNIRYQKSKYEYTKRDSQDESYGLLCYQFCRLFLKGIADGYFFRDVMRGKYYTLKDAIRQIEAADDSKDRKELMIGVLSFISQNGGINEARSFLYGENLTKFASGVEALVKNNINPITIPEEFNVTSIPKIDYVIDKLYY